MLPEVTKLRAFCRRWGGDIVEISAQEYEQIFRGPDQRRFLYNDRRFFDAPFCSGDLGVDWEEQRILYTDRRPIPWPAFTHEMGHLFGTLENPNQASEVDFFGWEYLLAQRVGNIDEWVGDNRDYVVDCVDQKGKVIKRDVSFGDLTMDQRGFWVDCQIQRGKDLGIITTRGGLRCVKRTHG